MSPSPSTTTCLIMNSMMTSHGPKKTLKDFLTKKLKKMMTLIFLIR